MQQQPYVLVQQGVREYQQLAPVIAALNRWYGRALNANFVQGAWIELHPNGALLYNCGGIRDEAGGNYGYDYVTGAVYHQLLGNLPGGFQVAGGPTAYGSGRMDSNGNNEYVQDYFTITRQVKQLRFTAPVVRAGINIPAGIYPLVLNFHLYVDQWEINPNYAPPPNDPNHFPPLQ